MSQITKRSKRPITRYDLCHLRELALEELASFFQRRQDLRRFRRQLIAIALCQGAALHHLDKKNGVKDFDVFSFFSGGYDPHIVNRRAVRGEFGLPKFGVHPDDAEHGLTTRRIDFFRRFVSTGLRGRGRTQAEGSVCAYFEAGATKTARCLAKKAAVGLWPNTIYAKVLWPKRGART